MPAKPSHVVILGGGVTGLSSAIHLGTRFPSCRITLLEKFPRIGGWIRSETVKVLDAHGSEGNIILEGGPRTLRPNAKSVLELIHELKLQPSLLPVLRTSPLARSRFLHIPENEGLVALPSSLISAGFTPLGRAILFSAVREAFSLANRPANISDESFEAFLKRRFGDRVAETLGSAMIHGIYAADARKLSVKAAFGSLWRLEEEGGGSVVRGMFRQSLGLVKRPANDAPGDTYQLGEVPSIMDGVSVFTFQGGMERLSRAMVARLSQLSNIHLRMSCSAESLNINSTSNAIQLRMSDGATLEPSHVISALPLPTLYHILQPSQQPPHLLANPLSSVTVVNLAFPSPVRSSKPLHPPGFGYLVPRPKDDYSSSSLGILGVVFDSSATDDPNLRVDKITVMLGGPYPVTAADIDLPKVLKAVAHQLGVDGQLPEPLAWRIRHQRDCIPTLLPGHVERMREMSDTLENGVWQGRLKVIGAGVGGVSVGDCVEAGRKVVYDWES